MEGRPTLRLQEKYQLILPHGRPTLRLQQQYHLILPEGRPKLPLQQQYQLNVICTYQKQVNIFSNTDVVIFGKLDGFSDQHSFFYLYSWRILGPDTAYYCDDDDDRK